ncbi:hypothetical protein EQG49_04040 [Periweissella cryptocerci]|uniref:Uncharacterized protein n=1 Tax=Periweissella cryptocerci TaxID=2506420 RepID=A0A4P6YSK0_9LACO|nr:hypothetical protein [Periweissella cryptocerci]QBO35688.1 hypothetical protein EQG49_04040 [Periweissella cryptocerci]
MKLSSKQQKQILLKKKNDEKQQKINVVNGDLDLLLMVLLKKDAQLRHDGEWSLLAHTGEIKSLLLKMKRITHRDYNLKLTYDIDQVTGQKRRVTKYYENLNAPKLDLLSFIYKLSPEFYGAVAQEEMPSITELATTLATVKADELRDNGLSVDDAGDIVVVELDDGDDVASPQSTNNDNPELTAQVQELTSQNTRQAKKITKQIKEFQQKVKELEDATHQVHMLEGELDSTRARHVALRKKDADTIIDLRKQVSATESLLRHAKETPAELQRQLERANTELNDVQEQLAAKNTQYVDLLATYNESLYLKTDEPAAEMKTTKPMENVPAITAPQPVSPVVPTSTNDEFSDANIIQQALIQQIRTIKQSTTADVDVTVYEQQIAALKQQNQQLTQHAVALTQNLSTNNELISELQNQLADAQTFKAEIDTPQSPVEPVANTSIPERIAELDQLLSHENWRAYSGLYALAQHVSLVTDRDVEFNIWEPDTGILTKGDGGEYVLLSKNGHEYADLDCNGYDLNDYPNDTKFAIRIQRYSQKVKLIEELGQVSDPVDPNPADAEFAKFKRVLAGKKILLVTWMRMTRHKQLLEQLGATVTILDTKQKNDKQVWPQVFNTQYDMVFAFMNGMHHATYHGILDGWKNRNRPTHIRILFDTNPMGLAEDSYYTLSGKQAQSSLRTVVDAFSGEK